MASPFNCHQIVNNLKQHSIGQINAWDMFTQLESCTTKVQMVKENGTSMQIDSNVNSVQQLID